MNYYFIGIGGTGMSGLAQVLACRGHKVSGSDRDRDFELRNVLEGLGIKIYRQDGLGVTKDLNKVIISRAVEGNNPGLVKARKLNIPIFYRQDILKDLFLEFSGIAVAGTSGKTTVTGMIGTIFDNSGEDLTIINGGIMKNYSSNVKIGKLPYYCIETDESEGNLNGFSPKIGVLTNIGNDHMPYNKLKGVYKDFADEVKGSIIINADSNFNIIKQNKITYAIYSNADIKGEDIRLYPDYSVFKVDNHSVKLNVPGMHNIYNSLAALGAARAYGVSIQDAVRGLEKFKGIRRRFELVGERAGIRVIDDYAHNPDKINASLDTAHIGAKRVIAVYQPHGYRPTQMFFDKLTDVFAHNLRKGDCLFMPDIYYAGGSVERGISSGDIIEAVKARNKELYAQYFPDRKTIIGKVRSISREGDTVLVMGARDNTLSNFAHSLFSPD